jgi:hypothetical protein
MSSTFAELYSDFQDAIKVYTPKFDVTEVSFMRMITRGIQVFQRETEIVQVIEDITRTPPNPFAVPEYFRRLLQVRNSGDEEYMIVSWRQFLRHRDESPEGDPTNLTWNYGINLGGYEQVTYNPQSVTVIPKPMKVCSLYGRNLLIHPDSGEEKLTIWFIPDLQAFSVNSVFWQNWFPIDTNFDNLFRTARINPDLAPYEQCFVDYAVAQWLKSQGSINYQVYERSFWDEVQRAYLTKPVYTQEAKARYHSSPWV